MTGALLAPLALLALLIAPLGGPAPVAAQTGPGAGDPTLQISGVTTYVPADGNFTLEVRVTPSELIGADTQADDGSGAENFELAVTVFNRLDGVDSLDWPLTDPLTRMQPVRLADLQPRDGGRIPLEIPIRSGDRFDDQNRIVLAEPGVYPVSVDLRSESGLWASAQAYLIRLPAETNPQDVANRALPIAIVLAVSPAEGLTIDEATTVLANHPDVPLTVLLQDGVQSQLAADAELRSRFTEALGRRQVVAPPALRLDPSALAELGHDKLYARVLSDGAATIEGLSLEPARAVTLVETPLTTAGATALVDEGLQVVISPEVFTATNGSIRTAGGDLAVMSFDRELNAIVTSDDTGPARANRLLAYLALRAARDTTPIVFGGPVSGRNLGRVFEPFFSDLTRPGAPQPVPITDLRPGPFPIRPAERPLQDLRPVDDLLQRLDAELETYQRFHAPGEATGSVGVDADSFTDKTTAALTVDRNPESRRRALQAILAELEREFAVVELPEDQSLTMAAQSAEIPLIIENRSDGAREVMLRFRSQKVLVAQHEQVLIVEPGSSSIDLDVEARSLGLSTLDVSVWTPDGEIMLAQSDFSVRSTAIPGLSLAITLGAFALLGLWWYLDSRRKQRDPAVKRLRRAAVRARAAVA